VLKTQRIRVAGLSKPKTFVPALARGQRQLLY
jgi:hypothetical protein